MLTFREEFRVKNFKFSYSPVQDFVTSPWFPAPVVIAYRLTFALYSLAWLLYLLVKGSISGFEIKAFFFITRWAYVVLMMYFVLSFIITIIHYVRRRQGKEHRLVRNKDDDEQTQVKDDETRWFHNVLWLFYDIAANMAISVTIYYWAIDYNGLGVTLSDINVHILNSVFMIFDHTVSFMPWRILHVIYPMIFSILYSITTVLYWLLISKEPIYSALDFSNNPGLAVGFQLGAVFVLVPLVSLFLYLVFRLRCFLENKWVKDVE